MTAVSDLDVQIKSLQQSLDEHFTKNEQKQIFLEKVCICQNKYGH